MRKLQQTRIHNPPEILGNCFPTVIACFLDLDSPEDVIQIQEKYKEEDWNVQLQKWLQDRGWICKSIKGHLYDDSFYTVTGKTNRGASHICIYQNGKLFHDPNPCNEGILTEDLFESITKITRACILCKEIKEISEYYKHPQMPLGFDSKCKQCVKTRAQVRHQNLTENNPEFVNKERERHREKYHRLGYKEQQIEWDKDKPWKKSAIYKSLSKKLKLSRGFEAHHWNYNDEYLEDVFVLEIRPHKKLHTYLTIDVEKKLFYLKDGTYLDTKEKHEEFIKSLEIKIYN